MGNSAASLGKFVFLSQFYSYSSISIKFKTLWHSRYTNNCSTSNVNPSCCFCSMLSFDLSDEFMMKHVWLLLSIWSDGSCRSRTTAAHQRRPLTVPAAHSVVRVTLQLFARFLFQALCWRWGLQLFWSHDTRTHTGLRPVWCQVSVQADVVWAPVIAHHPPYVFPLSGEPLRDLSGLCFLLLRALSKHWRCSALSLLSGCEVFVTVATPTPSVMARPAYEATRARAGVWRGVRGLFGCWQGSLINTQTDAA